MSIVASYTSVFYSRGLKWIALQFQWFSGERPWCGPTRHLPVVREECPADGHRFVPTTLHVGGFHRTVCPPAHLRIAVCTHLYYVKHNAADRLYKVVFLATGYTRTRRTPVASCNSFSLEAQTAMH